MRLVLDQGIPRDAAVRLHEQGHECTHVGEVGMSSARDEAILEFALRQNAVVVTLDADFHALLAVFGAHRPSVVRIRMQGLGALAVVHVVERTLGQFADDIENGALVTVKANKTSCRKLPIGGAGT